MDGTIVAKYKLVISEIGALRWTELSTEELTAVAMAYHYFSIQFRENLLLAVSMFPYDQKLQHLMDEECHTSNLSPWPGVAESGERMNHDEFMRRALALSPLPSQVARRVADAGEAYLRRARIYAAEIRACSIGSYEDGGLETTFRAMLTAPEWSTPALAAFKHFLAEHVRFDSDPDQGHGALSRHLAADDRVLPLWEDFRDMLICAAPKLTNGVALSVA